MKFLCFDSNSILNRAFYGIKLLTTKDGLYTNAVFGFYNMVSAVLQSEKPDAVAFAFDLPGPTKRHELYADYKGTRKAMPDELRPQIPLIKELVQLLGYKVVEREGFEADDVLGTFARVCEESSDGCVLVTGDRDSLQLVGDHTKVLLLSGRSQNTLYDEEKIEETYGLAPRQLIDVKALMGDASDNIPGVKGVGEKTALALIQSHRSLDELYQNLDAPDIKDGVRSKLQSGEESARLSYTLAEIDRHVPLDENLADYKQGAVDTAGLYALLQKLEFFKIIDKLGLTPGGDSDAAEGDAPAAQAAPALACEELAPHELADSLGDGPIGVWAVWDGDAPTALYVSDGARLCMPHDPSEGLKALLEARAADIVAAAGKQLWRFALASGIAAQALRFDCELAGYLLNPNANAYDPPRLCGEYGVAVPADDEGTPAALLTLMNTLEPIIDEREMDSLLHDIEMPLAQVLASMELEGFLLDKKALRAYGDDLIAQMKGIEQEIYKLAGHEFNIGSPKQLSALLFEELGLPAGKKTKTGYSTDADTLESLRDAHPIIGEILEYRKLSKLNSTYVEGLLKAAGDADRVHTRFIQTETRTGRISSVEPNMQNIPVRTPEGAALRRFFLAGPGNVLIDADYSQIELRVLAHIANDSKMRGAFLHGADIHTQTAAQVFGLSPGEVTPAQRRAAKAVNFGIVYGISAFSLAQDIGVPVFEADRYIKNYLRTYDGVRQYMEDIVEKAKEQGYVSTLYGRRRYLPELKSSNYNIRQFGQRVALNAPIQGTSADIIKIAMVRAYRALKEAGLEARLILQVHDELIVEAPEAEREQASAILKDAMENAAALTVPLTVDVSSGGTWYDAKA